MVASTDRVRDKRGARISHGKTQPANAAGISRAEIIQCGLQDPTKDDRAVRAQAKVVCGACVLPDCRLMKATMRSIAAGEGIIIGSSEADVCSLEEAPPSHVAVGAADADFGADWGDSAWVEELDADTVDAA